MGFPIETTEGEIVQIAEKTAAGLFIAEDGRTFKPSLDALRLELIEAGEAIDTVTEEVSEAIGEVVTEVKEAVTEVVEAVGDAVDAVETAAIEVGDVVEAAGDVVEAVTSEPLEAAKEVFDYFSGNDEEVPSEPPA